MGKLPYMYTDSDETEETSSSVENVKKKKKFSILKYTTGNIKKKKCKLHSKSEPDDSDYRSRSGQRIRRLHGILKNDKEKDYSTDDDEESEPSKTKAFRSQDKCLVGRVPRPAGVKPGRGGGVAIIVRKNVSGLQPQESTTSNTKRRRKKRLARKKSY
ncbi:uncharacterized protein LOC114356302 [Ostrinia furnacalis]|uniref:uncharacterized protein LOC114356302 n=1 Tax=Ostrinia furnacalis TaxID=93504 RepID=UPI00103CC220|nr:uncharacterized protein LOC114356302 [Ostrinia furnacalis]